MKILRIEIKNLSPLVLSSGSGVGTLIDTDIEWDYNELPVFSGRRLKGLLKESAMEVQEFFEQSKLNKSFEISKVGDLFGVQGGYKESKLKFYNLSLKDISNISDYLEYLKNEYKNIFNVEIIKNSITQIRQQTAIDENGIEKKGSLRTIRALNPNFTFSGEVILLDESQKNQNLLALACQNLKHAGLNRNRGYGEVLVKLFDDNNELTKSVVEKLEKVVK